MLKETRIDQVGVFVSDFDSSLKFYRDLLKLEPIGIDKNEKWAQFFTGTFIMVLKEHPRAVSSGGIRLYFTVNRISSLRTRLFDAGVPVSAITENRAGKTVDFSDPDGNRLGLFEPSEEYVKSIDGPDRGNISFLS